MSIKSNQKEVTDIAVKQREVIGITTPRQLKEKIELFS